VCHGETWLDTAARRRRRARGPALRLPVPGLRAVPTPAAWENVAYPLRELPRRERRGRAHELLERFGLAALADARPRTLSGGERQRVALARALARRPHALLLDEPLSALDARTRKDAARTLAGLLRDLGVPAVLVTHDFAEAAELGDRIGVMDAGRVVQEGTASEIAARPLSAFVADFAGAVVLLGSASSGPDGLTIVELAGGGTVVSTDVASGPVAASVFPWEIALGPVGAAGAGSAQNGVVGRVVTLTTLGNRVRVALDAPQPLAAEVTTAAAAALGLRPGVEVVATWKATVTRLTPR
jgi:molybdate transport system ATP-binding protein